MMSATVPASVSASAHIPVIPVIPASRILTVHLGQILKAQWVAYCATQGKKPGTVIREAIEAQLKVEAAKTDTHPKPDPIADTPKKSFMNDFPESDDSALAQKIRFEARLTSSEHATLKALLAASGCRTLSQWLKKSTADSKQSPLHIEHAEHPDASPKSRMEFRLTASERQALVERAEKGGMTPQQWLVGLVRANLVERPQFGMYELNILGESNYQLLAIGRNLNQIAKHLHEGLPEQVTPAAVENLRAEIRAHVEAVSKAMRGNLERWIIR
jgi:hypothetical protein